MTADQAFASLMRRNALAIPVVEPSASTDRWVREDAPGNGDIHAQDQAHYGPGRDLPEDREKLQEETRVAAFPEGTRGDYRPQDSDQDSEAFTTPTETELEAVVEGLLGENVPPEWDGEMPAPSMEEEDSRSGEDGEADTAGYDEVTTLDGGLGMAKQVRRLAYLPLEGMERFEDQARDLMAKLQSEEEDRPSLALVSPVRGQGQTEIAMRLAFAMARRVDYRILLADFDLRQPQVARRLGISSAYFTLADVLRGSCPLGEALIYSEEDNLFVLPTRVSERVGDEFLDGSEVRNLLDQIHQYFDFSILCCGGMDHSDAVTICRQTGFTALAGYCGLSRARDFRAAAGELSEAGARVAGMLLTGA